MSWAHRCVKSREQGGWGPLDDAVRSLALPFFLRLLPLPSADVAVPAEVPDQALALIGDMGDEGGEPIQGREIAPGLCRRFLALLGLLRNLVVALAPVLFSGGALARSYHLPPPLTGTPPPGLGALGDPTSCGCGLLSMIGIISVLRKFTTAS
jgi:hypothetical protein